MLLVGATMGVLGGGGALLTVPVLVYLFHVGATDATGYSLAVVGITSIVGAIAHWRRGLVAMRMALIFAIPSLVTVYLTRAYLIPALPVEITILPGMHLLRDRAMMLGFAALMAVTAIAMIRSKTRAIEGDAAADCDCRTLAAEGLAVGFLAGLFGAGGGFLIVPALVLIARLPIRLAVGTSLMIISVQSLLGFAGSMQAASSGAGVIDWLLLLEVTSIALAGMGIGLYIGPRMASHHLKTAFGWFVLTVGVGIGIRELIS